MHGFLTELFVSHKITYSDLDGKMGEIKKMFFSYNLLSRNIFLFLINKENEGHEFINFLLKYILNDVKEVW